MSIETAADLLTKWHALDEAALGAELEFNRAETAVAEARRRWHRSQGVAYQAYNAWRVAQDAPDPEVVKANQTRDAANK